MSPETQIARPAGALYLTIIALGLTAELFIRSALIIPGDPVTTATNILAETGLFRMSLAGDALMVAADIALAVLLFVLFRPISPLLATLAATFRMMQAAVITASLLHQQSALLWLTAPMPGLDATTAQALAYQALDLHAHGYDLGLVFFGINSVLTGLLLLRAAAFAPALGYLLIAAGLVYITGSALRFLAPALLNSFAPAYLIAIVAETALALRLLTMGRNRHRDSVTWLAPGRRLS